MASTPGQTSNRWRAWCNDHPIGSLVLAGVIATQLGTFFGYVFPAVGLPTLPWPLYNGLLALGISEGPNGVFSQIGLMDQSATGVFFVGQALHFVNGIVFAILFGLIARHSLPGSSKTNGGNIQKGLMYGVIMTIISAGLLVPYAYVQNAPVPWGCEGDACTGYGLFSFSGPDGWKLPAGILVWHLIYGYFLGALYQPDDE